MDSASKQQYAGMMHQPNAQLGFIGGAGVEGGQGNSDSIYGSHDDHSTYGVSGSGWQGPGNGEQPGDLWNPAVGQRQGMGMQQNSQAHAGMKHQPNAQLGFVGGAGVEGGQGNSDSIYGSHDDHSTYGVGGSGWQGPGNGEQPGDLWNPAVGQRQGMGIGMQQISQAQLEAKLGHGQYAHVPLEGQQQQQKYAGMMHQPNAQLGFIGGAGVEGGQGNSDSIYGSHDDHSTYGVSGSGWQGPGNGEQPGDLWNPAVGQRQGMGMQQISQAQLQAKLGHGQYALVPVEGQQQQQKKQKQQQYGMAPVALDMDGGEMPMPFNDDNSFPVVPGSNIDMFGHYEPASPRDNPCARFGQSAKFYCDQRSGRCGCVGQQSNAQLGFIGGAGVEGGQGNSDSIYGSHDDHSTYGVSGSGWQGPGNGEQPGDLWNPAVGQRQGMGVQGRRAGGSIKTQKQGIDWFGGNMFEHLFKTPQQKPTGLARSVYDSSALFVSSLSLSLSLSLSFSFFPLFASLCLSLCFSLSLSLSIAVCIYACLSRHSPLPLSLALSLWRSLSLALSLAFPRCHVTRTTLQHTHTT